MKEHPLLFSTPMVRALLAGTKTQTRRIIKPQPPDMGERWTVSNPYGMTDTWTFSGERQEVKIKCRYSKGDRIYVRESGWVDNNYMPGLNEGHCYWKADDLEMWELELVKAHYDRFPSIHMPKDLARIWLEITDVRVERLQDITNDDAKAEGVGTSALTISQHFPDNHYRNPFRNLWDQINFKRGSWDANPWVWVLTFTKLKP